MGLTLSIVMPPQTSPDRADRVLAQLVAGDLSRSALANLMRSGLVLLDGKPIRPSTVLKAGDRLEILARETAPESQPQPPVFSVRIISEDSHVIVVDKPAGLVVHPGAGRSSGTLMDYLVSERPELQGVGEPDRWGIVHRLDRDTSGVMVAAKTPEAHAALSAQFKEHSVHRIYLALVRGNPSEDEGIIDAPLGRHVKDRKRMSTATRKGRRAVTTWAVLERFGEFTLLEIRPKTGRTHQIRVHMASRGLPVAGDSVYGRPRTKGAAASPQLKRISAVLKRQALHAAVLGFLHPKDSSYVEFTTPLPEDMSRAVEMLRETARS